MKYGGQVPIIKQDLVAVRDLAQSLEGAGFDIVALGGHVMAAPEGRYEGRPPMTYKGPFHDPFVLFAYLAGVTERIHFLSSVLILPLMPTPLVAKQAAELQYVSNGRFELGVGISWNEHEFQAMGQDLKNRARRMEEQMELLRRFWKQPYVSFEGRYHSIDNLGLGEQPVDVPIWIGCAPEDRQLRRVAKYADGWLPLGDPASVMEKLHGYLREEGRDPASLLLQGRVVAGPEGPEAWIASARHLQETGVTHISIAAPPGGSPAESLAKVLEARKVIAEAIS